MLPAQQQMALSRLLQKVLFDEELLKALEQVVRQGRGISGGDEGFGVGVVVVGVSRVGVWGTSGEGGGSLAGEGVEFGFVPGCSENVHRIDSSGQALG